MSEKVWIYPTCHLYLNGSVFTQLFSFTHKHLPTRREPTSNDLSGKSLEESYEKRTRDGPHHFFVSRSETDCGFYRSHFSGSPSHSLSDLLTLLLPKKPDFPITLTYWKE